MAESNYRDIVEEPEYTDAIAQIEQRFPRVRQVEAGLHWSLARNPTQHYQVPGTKYHITQTADYGLPDIPVIRVLYWYDDDQIFLVAAMVVTPV